MKKRPLFRAVNAYKMLLTVAMLGGIVLVSASAVSDVNDAETETINAPAVAVDFNAESTIAEVLHELGEQRPLHYTDNNDTAAIRMGRELVMNGRTVGPDGKRTRLQSKHFVCTNCHNTDREDADLKVADPDARLRYTAKKNMPFLQGTTFWGMVNRETWYNDDYLRKYGDLVRSSRDTLKNAIHLCTIECSQGRPFKAWEMDAVMAYFYTLQMKLADIGMLRSHYDKLQEVVNGGDQQAKTDAIGWIKSQYMTKSPATFMDPQKAEDRKLGAGSDASNGKLLYDNSCKTCHKPGGVTNFILDDTKMTFKKLERSFTKHSNYSTYQITRKGTYAEPGYHPYMPHYTKERMSDKQLEDLNAYITQEANK
jgi:cytochrome c